MIRQIENDDFNQVNELLKEFNYNLESKSFDNKFLKVLVYDDKNIKGVLVYEDLIGILIIDYIIVSNECRKNGVATKMLKYLERQYKSIDNITLEVRKSNIPAINFYKKNGFKEATIRKNYYGNEDGILMIKEFR